MSKWQKVRLGDVVTFNSQSITKKHDINEIEYLDIASVGSNINFGTQTYKLIDAPGRAKRLVSHGDTIFSTVRPNLKTYLKIKNPQNNLVVSTGFAVISPTKYIDSDFLFYSVTNQRIINELSAIADSKTTSYPAVSSDDIANLEIYLPSKYEQKIIGNILSSYDNLIENNNRRIAILEEMAQRLYREWFVHFRFPGHENKNMVESELGLIPEGWGVSLIDNVVSSIRKIVRRKDLNDDNLYIGIEHIPRKKMVVADYSTAETIVSDKLCFEKDDVLFGKIRTYFHKVAIAPFSGCCSTDIIVLRLNKERYAYDYLTLFSDEFVSYTVQISQGTKMPRTEWRVAKNYNILAPDAKTLYAFNKLIMPLLEQISLLVQKNTNLRKTRDLLLPHLISGDIDVSGLPIPTEED